MSLISTSYSLWLYIKLDVSVFGSSEQSGLGLLLVLAKTPGSIAEENIGAHSQHKCILVCVCPVCSCACFYDSMTDDALMH